MPVLAKNKLETLRYLLVIDVRYEGVKIKKQLEPKGYHVLLVTTVSRAMQLYREYRINMIFISIELIDKDAVEMITTIRSEEREQPVIVVLEKNKIKKCLPEKIMNGLNDNFSKLFSKNILFTHVNLIDSLLGIRLFHSEWIEDQKVAKNIFDAVINTRNLIIEDMRIHCQAADVFCGDMVLTAKHPNDDLYVLFVDLTGHGLSAAIAILPVSDMFSNLVEKEFSAEMILQEINARLLYLLPTGMFMACCMIKINLAEKTIGVWNAGMPDVYLIDTLVNDITKQFVSSGVPLGIVEMNADSIHFETVKIKACNQIFMLSDGVTDVLDEKGNMLGICQFERLLKNGIDKADSFDKIMDEIVRFKGSAVLQDDVTLVMIPFKNILRNL